MDKRTQTDKRTGTRYGGKKKGKNYVTRFADITLTGMLLFMIYDMLLLSGIWG